MSGTLVLELEYHHSDGAFGDGSHVNITIRYYGKTNRFAIYKLANISNLMQKGYCARKYAVWQIGIFFNISLQTSLLYILKS